MSAERSPATKIIQEGIADGWDGGHEKDLLSSMIVSFARLFLSINL